MAQVFKKKEVLHATKQTYDKIGRFVFGAPIIIPSLRQFQALRPPKRGSSCEQVKVAPSFRLLFFRQKTVYLNISVLGQLR